MPLTHKHRHSLLFLVMVWLCLASYGQMSKKTTSHYRYYVKMVQNDQNKYVVLKLVSNGRPAPSRGCFQFPVQVRCIRTLWRDIGGYKGRDERKPKLMKMPIVKGKVPPWCLLAEPVIQVTRFSMLMEPNFLALFC